MSTDELITRCAEFIRLKKTARRQVVWEVVSADVQIFGDRQQLGGTLPAKGCPVDDGTGSGKVVLCDPAGQLHCFQCGPKVLEMLEFIAHKSSPDYRNKYGIAMGGAR